MRCGQLNRRTFVMAGTVGLTVLPAGVRGAAGDRERIRIGQIGVGHAHASKLSVYRASPDYEVVGLVEPDVALRERAQSQVAFRDLTWMTQEQLLNVPGLQAVLVETRARDSLSAVTSFHQHAAYDDALRDNMLAVLEYPRAIATVKSSAQEVEGFARRHFTVCGTGGTFHVQPLDSPAVRAAFSKPRGEYGTCYQDIALPQYTRYVDDAADMARILRGEKESDFSYQHDLVVQRALLQACQLPLDS